MTKDNLGLTAPSVGWSKLSHTIGSEPRFAELDENQVLACIGLAVSAHGYAVQHENAIITTALLTRHQVVPAASVESVVKAAELLVAAGIWEATAAGFDVGALEAIEELRARLERAMRAGKASGTARRANAGTPPAVIPIELGDAPVMENNDPFWV